MHHVPLMPWISEIKISICYFFSLLVWELFFEVAIYTVSWNFVKLLKTAIKITHSIPV
jgi:hypothetical protein